MNLSIMQPYFFPYIGYFQLINASDKFIIYDNIQYTKKGWINRNRILSNNKDIIITLPIKKASDYLDVRDREVADSFNKKKFLAKIEHSYNKAPFFNETYGLIEDDIISFNNNNLFEYLYNSVKVLTKYLKIDTEVIISSSVGIDHTLKSQDKVIALCNKMGATTYINAIGGISLYSNEEFEKNGMDLRFIQSKPFKYTQFKNDFLPWLSIIDVMMFNSVDEIKRYLDDGYELIKG